MEHMRLSLPKRKTRPPGTELESATTSDSVTCFMSVLEASANRAHVYLKVGEAGGPTQRRLDHLG